MDSNPPNLAAPNQQARGFILTPSQPATSPNPALVSGVKAYRDLLDRTSGDVVNYTHGDLRNLYDRYGEKAVTDELDRQFAAADEAAAPAREEHRRKAYEKLLNGPA